MFLHKVEENIQVDTTNILFIVGGAFDGIKDIIKQRTNKKSIGFGSEDSENKEVSLADVTTEDLLKFGLIPEFIGRVPIVVSLEDLDVNSLVKILQEPKNSLLKQYQKLFELDGVKLTFEDEAVKEIAEKAFKQETGARGLRTILEDLLLDVMFEIPSKDHIKEVIVSKGAIKDKKKLIYK